MCARMHVCFRVSIYNELLKPVLQNAAVLHVTWPCKVVQHNHKNYFVTIAITAIIFKRIIHIHNFHVVAISTMTSPRLNSPRGFALLGWDTVEYNVCGVWLRCMADILWQASYDRHLRVRHGGIKCVWRVAWVHDRYPMADILWQESYDRHLRMRHGGVNVCGVWLRCMTDILWQAS